MSWTRTTTKSYQFPTTSSKRTPLVVQHMDVLSGNERTSRLRKCCKMLSSTQALEDINPFLRDGTKTTNTESLCDSSGGPRRKLLNMTRLPWKTTPMLQQDPKEFEMKNMDQDGSQQPLNQRPDFVRAKRECKIMLTDM